AGSPNVDPESEAAGLSAVTAEGEPPAAGSPPEAQPSEGDEEVRDQIQRRLSEHAQLADSRIEVSVQNGAVKLGGIAANRFAKRRAEELAQEVPGVASIRNEIHIQPEQQEAGPILTTHLPGVDHGSTNQ